MIELDVIDANGVTLKVGARVAWASAASGRRTVIKNATITDIKLDNWERFQRPGRRITVSVATDGDQLKDSRSQFVADSCKSVAFYGIAVI